MEGWIERAICSRRMSWAQNVCFRACDGELTASKRVVSPSEFSSDCLSARRRSPVFARCAAFSLHCWRCASSRRRGRTPNTIGTFFSTIVSRRLLLLQLRKGSAPSDLTVVDDKLPVDTGTFFTPPNALRLEWNSRPGGGWEAAIDVMEYRNREILFHGDHISIWCYAPSRSPLKICRSFGSRIRGEDFRLRFNGDIRRRPPRGAMGARDILLRAFVVLRFSALDARRISRLVFSQSLDDAAEHTCDHRIR